jgi:hypothetical protein
MMREQKLPSKNREQQVDVLAGCDAAEQHDLALRPYRRSKVPRGALERLAVPRISDVDSRIRECAKRFDGHSSVGGAQAGVRRYHEHASRYYGIARIRGTGKTPRVRKLAPKVQTADEAEDVTERRAAATAQIACDHELRVRGQHELRPASGAVRGG